MIKQFGKSFKNNILQESIKIWIPNDINVFNPNYKIPNFENQIDKMFSDLNKDDDVLSLSTTSNELTKNWIDGMSFSHNIYNSVGNGDKTAQIGHLIITKYNCNRSPSLNYMLLRNEVIPHIIHRQVSAIKDNEIPITEYELHHCTIENISISGGYGGTVVESLSISCKTMITKNIKVHPETGQVLSFNACKWDLINNTGSKTIFQTTTIDNNNNNNNMEEKNNQNLNTMMMVDLDSKDPSTLKLLKELDIVSKYKVPESKHLDLDNLYRVLINRNPALFELIDIPTNEPTTIDSIKKSISKKLNIPFDKIKNIYNYSNGLMIDHPEILKISNSFIVQTIDGKLYGH